MQAENNILIKTTSPLTFLNWLQSQNTISKDYSTNLKNYQNYVSEWHTINKSSSETIQDLFIGQYIDLLNEISLTYSTEEEKRFLANCDFTNPEELDIVLPFFIQKLKTICLYYNEKREKLKQNISFISGKGKAGVAEDFIKNIVLEEVQTENLQIVAKTRLTVPSLTAVNENLSIKIIEMYDDEIYANKSSTIQELNVDPNLFVDFKEAVIQAIKKYPVFSSTFRSNFSFNLPLTGEDLSLLKKRDFVNYIVSDNIDDLKIQLYKKFTIKYMGCNMYYLSTGSTLQEITSGKLFETVPLSGNNILNPLNTRYPTTALIPGLSSLYSAYECGRFFTPSKLGALQYSSFDRVFFVDKEKLEPNKLYVFPDPNRMGNVVDSSGNAAIDYPLVHEIDVSSTKISYANAFRSGDIFSDKLSQLFYPYESFSQDRYKNNLGLSTPHDDVTFWGGEQDTVWTNSDIWPNLSQVEKLSIDQRIQTLLIDKGQMVKWFTDVYGNEYGLYKHDIETIFDKRNNLGNLYVKTTSNVVSSFSYYFRKFLVKYPTFIFNEIEQGIKNFYVNNNIILIETANYVIIDIINYVPRDNAFTSSQYSGFYRKKYSIDSNLEKLIGYTFRENNNSLYLCFTTLAPRLSSTNYKKIIPLVYKFDGNIQKLIQVYPGANDTDLYSLSALSDPPQIDLKYIESGFFSHKEKNNLYNLSYIGYNLNNIPFFVNEKFYSTPYSEKLTTTNPLLYKPFFYVYDTNYSYPDVKSETGFNSPYTDYAGHYSNEKFKFNTFDRVKDNVFAVSDIDPVFINQPGTYFLHLDWTTYNTANLFFGCSSQNIFYTEDAVIFPNRNIIILDEEIWSDILTFDIDERSFFVKAKIIRNSNDRIMEIYVGEESVITNNGTALPPFTGVFCNFPYSIFKEISIKKIGDGAGVISSTPPCVQCGDICTFLYPIGSTIAFRASALKESVFAGWLGGGCDGVAGDCLLQVSNNLELSAIFTALPRYNLQIQSNLPETIITSLDNGITCVGPSVCTYNFLGGTALSLSASSPPPGYNFKGFLGSQCGIDRVCSFFLNNNLSLTAFYEPKISTLILENRYLPFQYPTVYGYLMVTTPEAPEGLQLNNRDFSLDSLPISQWNAEKSDKVSQLALHYGGMPHDGSPGTVVCSLCPGLQIKYFLEIPVPTGITASISSTYIRPYEFVGYFGKACEGIDVNCTFRVRDVLSISAVFIPPNRLVQVQNFTAPVNYNTTPFYVNTLAPLSSLGNIRTYTEDGKLNCSTYKLNQTCSNIYLSGAVFSIFSTPTDGSRLHALWGSDGTFLSGTTVSGMLTANIKVTDNLVLSAFSQAVQYNTLTVTKSAPSSQVLGRVSIYPGLPGQGPYIMDFTELSKALTYPANTQIEIVPIGTFNVSKPLYTIGFSGLKYTYFADPQRGLALDPNNYEFSANALFELGVGVGINIVGNDAPYYGNTGPINVQIGESTLELNSNANVTVVFDSDSITQ